MPADLQKARDLFLHAVGKLPPEQWMQYVVAASAGDAELEHRVKHMLQVHLDAGSFLEHPILGPEPTRDHDPSPSKQEGETGERETVGTVIGPYKLLERIGEGGMGTVWMAEQIEPIRRKVALKVVKSGMDSRQVLVRFGAEQQALAVMDHPNIAKVFDAGMTPDGRPYFVMELVKGIPITKYCDEHKLTPRQRVELFIAVCQAIQHAHQKGIIHRDIKPGNVLVALHDDKPVPTVIDFGIAKATGQQLTEHTLHTAFGAVVGTVEYMSPEQASFNQLDVDTRSDIYSLGVLLYELLAGSTPFSRKELAEAGLLEVLRLIREQEPPKPSTKLSTGNGLPTLAVSRGTEPERLSRLVRGELDWIVMKALEKDRARRYETANGFAMDLQRYLADEPVQAGPPSAAYRARKFIRRNRGFVIAASVVLFVLVGGIIGTTVGMVRAQVAEFDKGQALEAKGEALEAEKKASDAATANATRANNEKQRADDEKKQAEKDRDLAQFESLRTSDAKHALQMFVIQRAKERGDLKEAERVLSETHPRYRHTWEERYLRAPMRHLRLEDTPARPEAQIGFTRDGKRIFTAGVMCDAMTGRELFKLPLGGLFALSPDDKGIVTRGETVRKGDTVLNTELVVWDSQKGQKQRTFPFKDFGIARLAYSPDGKWLGLSCYDGVVRLVDSQTGELKWMQKCVVPGPGIATRFASDIVFSGNGKYLVAGGSGTPVKVWATDTGQEKWASKISARGLACSPDGLTLAVATNGVQLWNLETKQEMLTLPISEYWVNCVTFSADGRFVAAGGMVGSVHVWDITTGRELATNTQYSRVGADVIAVAFSPNSRRLAFAVNTDFKSKSNPVVVWDLDSSGETLNLTRHQYPVQCLALSPDGKLLVSAADTRTWFREPLDDETMMADVRVTDAQTGEEKFILKDLPGDVLDLTFSPNGRFIATADQDYLSKGKPPLVKLWDSQTGVLKRTLPPHKSSCVSFNHDSQLLATGDTTGTVRIWIAETGELKHTWKAHDKPFVGIAFSREGLILATASRDGSVKLWDAQTGEEKLAFISPIPPPPKKVDPYLPRGLFCFAYHSEVNLIALGYGDGKLKLWDAKTGVEKFTLLAHTDAAVGYTRGVRGLAFSPDGQRLASGAQPQGMMASEVKVWDTKTGQDKLTLKGPVGIHTVAFSGDGRRIAAGGEDKTVRVWDAPP